MTDQSQNTVFHSSSFLQGQNADYVEQLHARYAENPASVDSSWQAFFRGLDDAAADVTRGARGPSWARARLAAGADRRADRRPRRPVGAGPGPAPSATRSAPRPQEKGVAIAEAQVRQAVTD